MHRLRIRLIFALALIVPPVAVLHDGTDAVAKPRMRAPSRSRLPPAPRPKPKASKSTAKRAVITPHATPKPGNKINDLPKKTKPNAAMRLIQTRTIPLSVKKPNFRGAFANHSGTSRSGGSYEGWWARADEKDSGTTFHLPAAWANLRPIDVQCTGWFREEVTLAFGKRGGYYEESFELGQMNTGSLDQENLVFQIPASDLKNNVSMWLTIKGKEGNRKAWITHQCTFTRK